MPIFVDSQGPSSAIELRSFCDLAGYHRYFVWSFSSIAKPMTRPKEKGIPFIWTNDCETNLIILKVKLLNTYILIFHESGKCFMDIQMHPIYALILSQCSLVKVAVDVVGRTNVVMIVIPLVLKMKCLAVSFSLCTYYVGQPT
jgi:hypothetical protein